MALNVSNKTLKSMRYFTGNQCSGHDEHIRSIHIYSLLVGGRGGGTGNGQIRSLNGNKNKKITY